MSDSTVPSSRPPRWGFRIAALLVLGGVVAVPLAVAGGAAAGCHGGWGGPESAEEARTMVKASARMLDRLDATDDQQARVDATLDTAVPTLFALHEEAQDLRDEVHDALLGETVDAARVEAARVDAVALADRGSRVMADAADAIFATLTPTSGTRSARRSKHTGGSVPRDPGAERPGPVPLTARSTLPPATTPTR